MIDPDNAIGDFCRHLVSSARPAATVTGMRNRLLQFFRRVKKPCGEVEAEDLAAFVSEDGLRPASLYTRFVTLRRFFGWLCDEGRLLVNPMEKLSAPRQRRNLPKLVMTKGEAEQVLAIHEADPKRPQTFRNRVMLELLYSCSLRRSELVNLRLADYDEEARSLLVRQTKTSAGRLAPVGLHAAELLGRYLRELRPQSRSPYIFLSKFRQPFKPDFITLLVQETRRKAGIRTKATAHSFRKTSATQMLKNGAKIEAVQKLLGHACIQTTQAYTKVYPADLVAMHRAHHPREKQKNQVLPELKLPAELSRGVPFRPKG